jgi:MOSC domain-containing protein YiiM
MIVEGSIHSVNVSDGGVPKLPVPVAFVGRGGVSGDRQRDLENHGGTERAVCIYSLARIFVLQAEGHPVAAGMMGENLTLEGIDSAEMQPGDRLEVGEEVELEVTSFANPCRNIAYCFSDNKFARVLERAHPGDSRLYARVIREGRVHPGDQARLRPGVKQATDGGQNDGS